MFQKNGDFSKTDLAKLLQQPQARALLARLQQMDQASLSRAVEQAFRGDADAAKESLLQDPELKRLADSMGDGHGGI